MFQLSDSEAKELISRWVSQSVIPIGFNTGGARIFAFTEQGVAMLSTVLRSSGATNVSIAIMRAFVAMRRFITANAGLFQRVELLEHRQLDTEKKLDVVLDKRNSGVEATVYTPLHSHKGRVPPRCGYWVVALR